MQVTVEIFEEQLERLRSTTAFEPWVKSLMESVPNDEQKDYEERARDLFVQMVCALKLDLAIERGIGQENQVLAAKDLLGELDQLTMLRKDKIQSQIVSELDLHV